VLGCLFGAVFGVYACTLQLDVQLACGDGYHDPDAGEECDPMDPSSFEGACGVNQPDGQAECDPTTCTIINDRDTCKVCGDNQIDGGEECDGTNLNNARCASGDDALRCNDDCTLDHSLCDLCGDTHIDPDEECDTANAGGLVGEEYIRPCATENAGTDEEVQGLMSPIAKPYASGVATLCTDCQLSRLGCSYCQDGVRDDALPLDTLDHNSLREVCDGDDIDGAALFEDFPNSDCWDTEEVQPNVACADNCLSFIPRVGEPECCLQSGAACPLPNSPFRCCYEYAHPDEANDACQTQVDLSGATSETCR